MKQIEPFGPFALAANVTPVAVPSPAGELSGLLTGPSAPSLVDGTPAISAASSPDVAGENRALLLSLMERSREILRKHPVNQKRIEAGLHPANSVWFWGEGRRPALTPFREKFGIARGGVISAVDLVQGIGVCAGLEVIPVAGITGNYHTDFAAKGRAAVEALRSGFDFLYIHVEAPDECGHHGEAKEKIWSIEQIDEKIILPVLEYLRESGEAFSALCMPDHPTPLAKLTHTPTPVPYALYRSDVNAGNDHRFTEAEAEKTGVFTKEACMLMPRLLEE